MFCPKCGKQLPNDAKFCGGCGSPVAGAQPVPPAQDDVLFTMPEAPYTPVNEPVFDAPPVEQAPEDIWNDFSNPDPQPAPEKKPRKIPKANILSTIPKKVWKLGGIALAAILVIVVLICVFSGGSSGNAGNGSGIPEGVLYLKEGELYYSDYSKNAPWEITGDLRDDASNYSLWYYDSKFARTIHVTEDGKTMFYMDKLDDDGIGTLYFRSLTNMSGESTKIAGGVSKYTVSRNGNAVLYLKNNTLYLYDMKEETKLGKDVSSYVASDDFKTVYYQNSEGGFYSVRGGESEKIGTDIEVKHYSSDYSTIYYLSGDKLYKKAIGKEKEKLLSNIKNIYSVSDKGCFYFTRAQEIDLEDFFTADGSDYDSTIDSYIKGQTLSCYELGYYDGKNDTILADYCGLLDGTSCDDTLLRVYARYDVDSADTATVTELMDYYYNVSTSYTVTEAAQEMAKDLLMQSAETCVAVNGVENVLELSEVDFVQISNDCKTMYFLCEVKDNEGDLYKATLSGTSVKKPEVVNDGVYHYYGLYFEDDWFVYFKDVKDDEGDLYIDGVLVDSDVALNKGTTKSSGWLLYYTDYDKEKEYGVLKAWDGKNSLEIYDEAHGYRPMEDGSVILYYDLSSDGETASLAHWNGKTLTDICEDVWGFLSLSDDGSLLLMTDYSSKSKSGTLVLWDGKKALEIEDDVYTATFAADGDVVYLYDYSTDRYEGELYRFDGKKSTLVDEDVAAIITLPGTNSHYYDY